MRPAGRIHRYTYADYVALELESPTVLLEVTSDSSEEYDAGTKVDYYRTIPTLRDYILVSHRERRITVHSRPDEGWTVRTATGGGRVDVASLDKRRGMCQFDEVVLDSSSSMIATNVS